jgi:hypothetical protein
MISKSVKCVCVLLKRIGCFLCFYAQGLVYWKCSTNWALRYTFKINKIIPITRCFPDRDHISRRVPVQASKVDLQDAHLPPKRRREGTSLSAHRRSRKLETSNKNGTGLLIFNDTPAHLVTIARIRKENYIKLKDTISQSLVRFV